jgi:hypothetical protein
MLRTQGISSEVGLTAAVGLRVLQIIPGILQFGNGFIGTLYHQDSQVVLT